jgi:hypothetical protein
MPSLVTRALARVGLAQPRLAPAKTGRQVPRSGMWPGAFGLGFDGFTRGYEAPPPGTIETYRAMGRNPTIALAKAVAKAPVRAAGWSYEEDDDAPAGALELIQDCLDPNRDAFVNDAMYALDYGYAPFESVWGFDEQGRQVIVDTKPLLPELTEWLTDDVGNHTGLRNKGMGEAVDLLPSESFWFAYDGEARNPYGRSRHENIRSTAWQGWLHTFKRMGQYTDKAALILPMVEYPEDERVIDANGTEVDALAAAQAILSNLGKGLGVTLPRRLQGGAEDMVNRGIVKPADVMAWSIKFLETRSGAGGELVDMLRHDESLLLRGWLVPERAAIEGQFGTKAEAGTHGDLATVIGGFVLADLVRQVNVQIVDRILVRNYGPSARGKVRAVPNPISDEDKAWYRALLSQVLTNPSNIDLMLAWLDVDGVFDKAKVPKRAEVLEPGVVTDPNAPALPAKPLTASMARLGEFIQKRLAASPSGGIVL